MTPHADLTLEPVLPADQAALLAMARAFHAEDGHALTPAGERAVTALCAGDPMALAWFLSVGGGRVGYAVLSFGFSIEHGGRELGTAALDALERQAAGHGVQSLHLEVEADNVRAETLYRRHHYRVTGRRLMSKRLAP
ncbi:MAG TPA: GNAT family N-acetyltransferase [Vineibacter sp.]|nr:GNAT family N-acetyltransferase [Vineibacter sp.]